MANYEVILDGRNSIMTIIDMDTWGCFGVDEGNQDYRTYKDFINNGGQPTYVGGDPTAANYPGPKAEPSPAPADTTTPPADTSTTTPPADTSSTPAT